MSVDSRSVSQVEHLLSTSRYAEAETLASSLLASEPDSPKVHVLLARAVRGQGRTGEALEHARAACRLRPEGLEELLVLSECALSDEKYREAIEAATRARETAPHSWQTHYTLGHVLLSRAEPWNDDPLVAAREAERLAPTSPDVQNLIGMCLAHMGNRRGARAAYRRALELDPHASMALNNLASLDVRLRPSRAARLLTSAASLDPQHRVIQQNIDVSAWNLLVSCYRVMVLIGFALIGTRAVGAPWLRVLAVACLGAGMAWWVKHRVAQLPRGYRRSLPAAWARVSFIGHGVTAGVAVELVLFGVVAVGPTELVGGAWLLMLVIGTLLLTLRRHR